MSYVYFITDHEHEGATANYVKVGITSDHKISNRLRALQTGNPKTLNIHSVLDMKDFEMAKATEKLIHWNLRQHRASGEWFHVNDFVSAYILEVVPRLGFHFWGNPEEIFIEAFSTREA
jgi:hypothetical protein